MKVNLMEKIDNDIFRIHNKQKAKKRICKIWTCFLGIFFFISELAIHWDCLEDKPSFLSDIFCYAGLIVIGGIEIRLLKKKCPKQNNKI